MFMPASAGTMFESHPLHDTLNEVLGMAARLFTTRLVAVSRVEGTTCTLTALLDHQRQIRPGLVFPLQDTLCAPMLAHNAPYQIDNISVSRYADRSAPNPLGIELGAYLGVPLRLPSGRVWGSLWTLDTEPHAFTPANVRMLSMLAQLLVHELERAAAQQHEQRIEEIRATHADIDPLTGLLGGTGFRDTLAQVAAQHPSDVFAVCVVRMHTDAADQSKIDVVRQGVADMLMRTVRLIDYCGRIGDNLFAVLLPGTTCAAAHAWQQRFLAEIEAWNLVHRAVGLAVNVALGVADSSEASGTHAGGTVVLEYAQARID